MATAKDTGYRVVALEDVKVGNTFFPEGEDAGRQRHDVRGDLGISAFGINAVRIPGAGPLVREHTEVAFGASGQEEVYIVLGGSATFTLDGEEVHTPAVSLVYVRP